MKVLPEKTVERLSEYRRTLFRLLENGKTNVFSHELADLQNATAVQVRRDIMFIGYSSTQRKGYDIKELIRNISRVIDPKHSLNTAVVGWGYLGKAITNYFVGKRPNLQLVAAFDLDPKKIGSEMAGVKCFSTDRLREIITSKNIVLAILTVPSHAANDVAKELIETGIKGILNFTGVVLNLPSNIYVEESDMITSLEKVAYYVKCGGQ